MVELGKQPIRVSEVHFGSSHLRVFDFIDSDGNIDIFFSPSGWKI